MGIDLERFPDVNPELVCSICAGVLEDPVESPCRHVFCSACILRWMDTKHSCPNCRKKVRTNDLKPALPILKNIINKLKIRCDFAQNGCTETVELEQLETHISSCLFAPMACENEGCEITFPRRSKAEHEAECPKRVIRCSTTCLQGCGLQLRLPEVPDHNCVQSLKARVEELEKTLSVYSQRMSTLEEKVNDLTCKQQNGHSNSRTHTGTTGQLDVDSGLISLLSEDEESDNFDHRTLMDPSLSGRDVADALLRGRLPRRNRDQERRRSLRQLSPRRERSRSRSPLRRDESEDSVSTRNRERSPCESSASSNRSRRRSQLLSPFSPLSPSTSLSSSNTCGTSDSSVVQSTGRRRSRPTVIDDSSSVDSPAVRVQHSASEIEYEFDGIPEYAVFFSPPGSTEAVSFIGDRRVHQWLETALGSPSGRSSESSSSSTSC